jgi:hypothetical protein
MRPETGRVLSYERKSGKVACMMPHALERETVEPSPELFNLYRRLLSLMLPHATAGHFDMHFTRM